MPVWDSFHGDAVPMPWYSQNNKTFGRMVLMGSAVLAANGLVQKAQTGRGQ